MKKMFEDSFIYENLLLSFFSEEQSTLKYLLNDKLNSIINLFLEIFENEDMQKGTNHVQLIHQIYSNISYKNKGDFLRNNLHISNSTLQRYRERYCTTLKLIITRHLKN